MRPLIPSRKELERLDLCYMVLLDAVSRNSLIPQLVRTIGKDATISFLEHFSGMTLKVPSIESVRRSVYEISLYDSLCKIDRSDRAAVARAAKAYGKTADQALATYERIDRLVQLVADRPRRRT
jgi:hypothetical protein